MENLGYLYNEGRYIVVEFNGHSIESIAPTILKEIKGIKSYDSKGYFVLETNYGEEYFDLGYVLSELELPLDLNEELSKVNKFELGKTDRSKTNEDEFNRNIGFKFKKDINKGYRLYVTDNCNSKYKAVFKVVQGEFLLLSSSFGLDKYCLLEILGLNKEILLEKYNNLTNKTN